MAVGDVSETIETVSEVYAIKSRAVESSLAGLRDLVDYTLWRLATLVLVLMAAATTLGGLGYRLALGRPPGRTPS